MKFFCWSLLWTVYQKLKYVLLENKAFQSDSYFLEATWTSSFRVYSFKDNTILYAKYKDAIFGDQFYRWYIF